MNDLPNHVKIKDCKSIIYADDTNLCICGTNVEELTLKIRTAMTQTINWFRKNKMIINTNKTKIIGFGVAFPIKNISYTNTNFEVTENCKFLGIFLDRKLSWINHIENLKSRLGSAIFVLKKLRFTLNLKTLLMVYHAYFGSIIQYGIQFWGNSCHIKIILKLQKKAIRAMLGLVQRESCREHFKDLNIMTVISLYILNCLSYMHKHKGEFSVGTSVHNHQTRKNNEIRGEIPKNDIFLRSFVHQSIVLYNKIPIDIRNLNSKFFNQNLKTMLKSKVYYSMEEYINDTSKWE